MIEILDLIFDDLDDRTKSSIPFMVYPKIIGDERGSFSESFKIKSDYTKQIPFLHSNFSWVKQINRSVSVPGVIRGSHAQKGCYCQAKMVESITVDIVDVITDCRPESQTFGQTNFFLLSPILQNKLYVPRGFLHMFIVPKCCSGSAIFNYYCDNVYDKDSELTINPKTIFDNVYDKTIPFKIKELLTTDNEFLNSETYQYSDKDLNGLDYLEWLFQIKQNYDMCGVSWWRDV